MASAMLVSCREPSAEEALSPFGTQKSRKRHALEAELSRIGDAGVREAMRPIPCRCPCTATRHQALRRECEGSEQHAALFALLKPLSMGCSTTSFDLIQACAQNYCAQKLCSRHASLHFIEKCAEGRGLKNLKFASDRFCACELSPTSPSTWPPLVKRMVFDMVSLSQP